MDFIAGVLWWAFVIIVFMASVTLLGWRLMLAVAGVTVLAIGWWKSCELIRERCAGCWRCMMARMLAFGSVFGVLGAVAFAWLVGR